MAVAFIVGAAAQGTTSSVDTTGANLIVLATLEGASTGATVSDNKSNSYTGLTLRTSAVDAGTKLFYLYSPSVGSGHTFSTSISYTGIGAVAFSGAASSPFEAEAGQGSSGSVTTQSSGSITPAENGEVLVTSLGLGGTSSGYSIDSSFTIAGSLNAQSGVTYGGSIAYLIQGTAGAVNPAFSWTGGCYAADAIATFKAAAGATAVFMPAVGGTALPNEMVTM